MGTEVTGAVQPLSLEPDSYEALKDTLQPLLAKGPMLTLMMLVGECSVEATTEARCGVKACMDDVEQLLLACFRRSDKIVRCGERSCAAILLGAEVEGALGALNRFRRMLGNWPPLAVSLLVGLAAAPEQAVESQALLAQALKPRLRILPHTGAQKGADGLPRMDEYIEAESPIPLDKSRGRAVQGKQSKAKARAKQTLLASPVAEFPPHARRRLRDGDFAQPAETLTRARARALGVPYIAPPPHIPSSVRNLLSVEVMRQFQCLPIGRDRNALTVALADPTDRGVLHRLEELTGLAIFPVMTDPDALEALAQPVRSRRTSHIAAASAREFPSEVPSQAGTS